MLQSFDSNTIKASMIAPITSDEVELKFTIRIAAWYDIRTVLKIVSVNLMVVNIFENTVDI